jgi:hypothetical protein
MSGEKNKGTPNIIKTENGKGISYDMNGWKYISIRGAPYERGVAYGELSAKDYREVKEMLEFFMYESYGVKWEELVKMIKEDFHDMTKEKFPELYEEMKGITDGVNSAFEKHYTEYTDVFGKPVSKPSTTIDEVIAWNFYMSLSYWYSTKSDTAGAKEGGAKDRCSAFMAVGSKWTTDSKIVTAHNSFTDFIDGQYENYALDILPDTYDGKEGCRIIMQTFPCGVWSSTDVFVTGFGIIGTETTIGSFKPYEKKYPIGYRIRMAMQYGKTFDDYERLLCEGNSGDYANSWLLGNINDNSIMRIELGLKYANTEIIYTNETKEPVVTDYEIDGVSIIRTETYNKEGGYFIGFNAPYDPRIRQMECGFSGFYDIRRHQGARQVRLEELMNQYEGKIDIEAAKKIIADHYDVYLKKENPCSRTVCSHYELDAREYMSDPTRPKPYSLHGAVDACVVDTKTAMDMGFWGRFGNSCGTPFDINKFCDEHIQWKAFRPYVHDRPSQDWTYFKEYDGWSKPVVEEEKEENEEKEIEAETYGGKRKQKKIKKTRGGRKSRGRKGKRKTRRQRRKYMRGGEFDEEQDKDKEEITRTEQDGGEGEEVQGEPEETEVTQDEIEQIEGDSDEDEEVEGDGEQGEEETEEPEENEE